MSFIEERLFDPLSYGFSGGPTFSTRKIGLRNGHQRRNIDRSRPLHKFRGSFDRRDDTAVQTLLATFNATRGAAYGFRFKNPMDYQATDEVIAVADGTQQTVQLEREFIFGTESIKVPVRKPNDDVKIYEDGIEISATVDTTTGMVTFTGTSGTTITWTGTFDIPVFFVNDDFMATLEKWQSTSVEIELEEDISV